MSRKPSPDADLSQWLAARLKDAGRWPTVAWVAGVVGVVAVIAQAYALAAFFSGWIFEHRTLAELAPWWMAVPGAVAVRALAGWAKEEAGLRASRQVRRHLRADLVDRVGVLGPAWKSGQPAGELASRLQEQVDGLDAYLARYLPQQKLAVFGPVLIVAFVFPFNWICGLLLVVTAPLIPLFMVLVGSGARVVQTRQLRSLSRMSGHFLDVLRGLTTLKLLGADQRQTDRVAQVSDDFRVRTMEVLRLAFLSSTVLEFFSVLAIALTALYLGFTLLGQINFGVVLTFQTALFVLLLAPDFYQPLRDLGTLYHARAEALACAGQLKPILEAPPVSPVGGSAAPPAGAPALSLRGVDFAYQPEVPVLRGVTLEVAAGEAVAVVGPSGIGKTTLLRLLLGELAPNQGQVLVDGRPLVELDLERWRAQVAWMGQHPRLMAATLGDNLRVARTDATDAELLDALAFAGLGEWIPTLDQGLATRLGEGGRTVSGGQLRRLALARLKLRKASVLLLDEPTASLDDATQAGVLASLQALRQGRTLVLLTHHVLPLKLADRTVTLGPIGGKS